MNLTKYFMTSMPMDDSTGQADFPSNWNLRTRKGTNLFLNWSCDTPAVRSVLIDSALGLGEPARPWLLQRMADLDTYLSNLPPPRWPFTARDHQHRDVSINPPLATKGRRFYARCAACLNRTEFTNRWFPSPKLRLIRRMYSWSKDAAAEANAVSKNGHRSSGDGGTQNLHAVTFHRQRIIWLRAPTFWLRPTLAGCSIRERRPKFSSRL
jgi:hypothetical protein